MIKYKIIFKIFSVIILFSCANVQPPSGGPPDKTPPEIIDTYPHNKTINFNENNISIEFSEWMNRNSVQQNIYISPSVKLSYEWSGTELEIELEEKLKENTTYVLNLGTEYTDLKQNKPTDAFTLIFSTGNYIDSGAIHGILYNKEPSGIYIYAYKIDNINPDTLNPNHTKPNYRTQVGTSGNFKLIALKIGTYRIFAIKDELKNELYDYASDKFGAAIQDIEIKDSIPAKIQLKIGHAIDNIPPILYNAEPYYNNLISLNFSEPIDSNTIDTNCFKITDSLETKSVEIIGSMFNKSDPNSVMVMTAEPLDTNVLWKIEINTLNNMCIKDTTSNPIQDSSSYTFFYSNNLKDTLKTKLSSIPFKDSSYQISFNPELRFKFPRPIFVKNYDSLIYLFDSDSNMIALKNKIYSGNILISEPTIELSPKHWYELQLNLKNICYTNNLCFEDSILTLNFETMDKNKFGGAKGKIKNFNIKDTNLIVLFYDNTRYYQSSVNDTGYWELKYLPPSNYTIEVFYDEDHNKKYTFGNPAPFKHSEPFIIIKDKKEIKSRWTIEMILPKPKY